METFTPTSEDIERAKVVLSNALRYEFDMLDAASRYMQTSAFSKLSPPKNQFEWLTRNATIEVEAYCGGFTRKQDAVRIA